MSRIVRGAIHSNAYRDSVELMGIAAELERLPGIVRAGLVMATPANLGVLEQAGLRAAAEDARTASDLVVAVEAESDEAAEAALARAKALLASGTSESGAGTLETPAPRSIAEGLATFPDANLALISTPGAYATAEALRALKFGMHVFLFSDNVPIEDELELKREASRRGLLVMGPDCGTAIVGGVPLGFANAVRRGEIGLAAASGTGLQQVSCLIDRLGAGVSHALGTGGRDLDERVGGVTMLAAVQRLLADHGTRVLVLISKPPAESVARRVLDAVRNAPKPVVVNFLGGDPETARSVGAYPAATFEAAARTAVELLATGRPGADDGGEDDELLARAGAAAAALAAEQVEIRGLFSGGSLAGEAKLLLGKAHRTRILDLGDDEYTVGRPHPMIDPRLRSEQIVAAAADPSVGVILLDVVLGYGSHPDPAGALVPAIDEAVAVARAAGRGLVVVASVCGTEQDPQGLLAQEATLRSAGVLLAPSNARAARLAGRIVAGAGRTAAGVAS